MVLTPTPRAAVFTSVLAIAAVFSGSGRADGVANVCDDIAFWPPYVFSEETEGSRPQGATVDVIKAIFDEARIEFTISLLPWKRCLKEVENFGSNRKYELFSNGVFSEERKNTYHMTLPLYTTRAGLFYSAKNFPNGLDFDALPDLKKYNFCGVLGYHYGYYENVGITVDAVAGNNEAALKMVSLGRCDVFPATLEAVIGSEILGKSIVPTGVTFFVLQDTPELERTFHIYISRGSERAETLLNVINDGILRLRKSGAFKKIFDRYYEKIGLEFELPRLPE